MDLEIACSYLAEFMYESRINRIEQILEQRTRFLTVVLEDIYHPQNASAIIRTTECLGIQDIHVIEKEKCYSPNADIARGASKWLTIKKYSMTKNKSESPTTECLETLKANGYSIIAAIPHPAKTQISENLTIEKPLALCLGTEDNGLSDLTTHNADHFIKIPMHGFTESFNVSVAAGILLSSLAAKIRNSNLNWHLSENEKIQLRFNWYKKSVKNADKLLSKKFHTHII